MGAKLFEESNSSSESEDDARIKINKEFALRFEHNKQREDVQRLEELKKRGLVDHSNSDSHESNSSSSDSDAIGSNRNELQFFDALVKVKNQDPILNQKDMKLFNEEPQSKEEEDDDSDDEENAEKKKKPMYLKDVVSKQLMEEGAAFEEKKKEMPKIYNKEQEDIRKAFLKAAKEAFDGNDADDGDFLVEKKRNEGEDGVDGDDEGDGEIQKRLDEYFGEDGKLSENEMFLKSFFRNKMWLDKEKGQKLSKDEILEVSEEEEELEKQDKYEAEYNFRYEEGAGDRVLGHSRFVEGSVRKKKSARQEQRKSKAERMKQAEFERKEELKHLKNVKKKEILEKMEKIRAVAGIAESGACTFDGDDLEEDFDSEEYDMKMKKIFNEEYYEAEDADPDFGNDADGDLEKPDFEKEDEFLGLPKDWDVCRSGGGFLAAREEALKLNGGEKYASPLDTFDRKEEEEEEEEEGEEMDEGSKRRRKRKLSLKEKVALDKGLEDYYKLDYEDVIGDLKTRFKYTSVPPNRYGLSTTEILMTHDNELNQYVSLKKIAPFREVEWKVSKEKRYQQKMKKKLLLQGREPNNLMVGKKQKSKKNGHAASSVSVSKEIDKTNLEEPNGEVGSTSRRSRRRRRQAELKLSQSRLMAYGKIPPKPKKQKKN